MSGTDPARDEHQEGPGGLHAPDAPDHGQEDAMTGHDTPEAPTGPAVGTLVWGCVVLAVAALLGAWELAGLRLDLSLVVPVGMVVLGLLLVVGAVATAVRSNRG